MNRISRNIILFIFILMISGQFCSLYAETAAESEYRLKAAFLYNFAKFVEWKSDGKFGSKPVFTIGILGNNPFGDELDILKGKEINGSEIDIKEYDKVEDVKSCNVLFVSSSEHGKIEILTAKLKEQNILTVGDTIGYAVRGVMINLYRSENRLRFEINNRAAESAGIKISSHLLRLGKLVEQD